jgi:hypothetical protein
VKRERKRGRVNDNQPTESDMMPSTFVSERREREEKKIHSVDSMYVDHYT